MQRKKPIKTLKPNEQTKDSQNLEIVSAALFGTRYLVLLQISSRILTFILNQIIKGFTTAEAFGIVALKLDFLQSTILFLCREGFRCAFLRAPSISKKKENGKSKESSEMESETQEIINLATIPPILGILVGFIACRLMYTSLKNSDGSALPTDHKMLALSVTLYGIGALIVLMAEPLYAIVQNNMMFQIRAQNAIKSNVVVRYIASALGFGWILESLDDSWVILSFSIAQMVYAVVLSSFLFYFLRKKVNFGFLIPKKIQTDGTQKNGYYYNPRLLELAKEFTLQSTVKHFLTEGDKLVISWVCNQTDTGLYALAANYGSLPARMLFQPIEETSLRSQLIFGMLAIAFCCGYITYIGPIVVGRNWVQKGVLGVLVAYVFYLPFLGVNGILEAFTFSTASKQEIKKYSSAMTLFSLIYCTAIVVLSFYPLAFLLKFYEIASGVGRLIDTNSKEFEVIGTGAIMLVVANMINMKQYTVWDLVYSYLLLLWQQSTNLSLVSSTNYDL
ncbi:hypothetical protein BB559_002381 [Furculomyces boomerangus]|uniref:Man(5)GlcNAc(2)-PP-dolichol translocation protein RFT1 n=1 Tax=Furculomyces boomerangus TaxID=61424 RepID=A0A2T9YVW0_9FUNG|nr:hypothetical protein BB559_002381 [Furculomyces boomerangus]